jgi:hypothetical protein
MKAIKEKAMSNETDLDWLAQNVHVWPAGDHQPWCYVYMVAGGAMKASGNFLDAVAYPAMVTKDQWLARRAELQNKPRWVAVPSRANWLAQDAAGSWLWHSSEPECRNGGWIGSTTRGYAAKGCVLGDWRDTLEKRQEGNMRSMSGVHSNGDMEKLLDELNDIDESIFGDGFIPKDATTAKKPEITPSKYTKTIRGVSVDVYDVLQAWGVSNPALQHLIKKALQCGQRGHKDNAQDLQDIIDSAIRAKELES